MDTDPKDAICIELAEANRDLEAVRSHLADLTYQGDRSELDKRQADLLARIPDLEKRRDALGIDCDDSAPLVQDN